LWAGSFQKFLPSALEDRLTSERVVLRDLTAEQGVALLEQRLQQGGVSGGESQAFLKAVQLPQWFAREPSRLASARSLLRHAARAWDEWSLRVRPPAEPDPISAPPIPTAPQSANIAIPTATSPSEPTTHLPTLTSGLPTGGSGTSFQQLKLMLEKLRLERIAQGKQPMQVSESGTIYHEPEPTPSPVGTSVAEAPATIEDQFYQLRQRLLDAKALRIDPDLFGHLLGVGGKRLAVVNPSHIPVPGSTGPGAMVWQTPDGEILFGTEPHQDRAYWQALLAYARQRHAIGRSHLTVFSAAQEPVDLRWWLSPAEISAAENHYLEVVTLDADALATLYAADELIHTSEHNAQDPHTPDEVFAAVATHLEPFWKRILKPL
jgi:hypothetical protein